MKPGFAKALIIRCLWHVVRKILAPLLQTGCSHSKSSWMLHANYPFFQSRELKTCCRSFQSKGFVPPCRRPIYYSLHWYWLLCQVLIPMLVKNWHLFCSSHWDGSLEELLCPCSQPVSPPHSSLQAVPQGQQDLPFSHYFFHLCSQGATTSPVPCLNPNHR